MLVVHTTSMQSHNTCCYDRFASCLVARDLCCEDHMLVVPMYTGYGKYFHSIISVELAQLKRNIAILLTCLTSRLVVCEVIFSIKVEIP